MLDQQPDICIRRLPAAFTMYFICNVSLPTGRARLGPLASRGGLRGGGGSAAARGHGTAGDADGARARRRHLVARAIHAR